MKSKYCAVFTWVTLLLFACKSKGQIPEIIEEGFQHKYPKTKVLKWEQENDRDWEAEFLVNAVRYTAVIDINGRWIETEHEISISEVSEIVLKAIKLKYPGYEIDEIDFIESSNNSFYEFEIEKGNSELEVRIDDQGTLIAQKSEDDDDNDDDDNDDDQDNEDNHGSID